MSQGSPIAGKSLIVHEVARQAWRAVKRQGTAAPQVVSINCMSLKQPSAVFMRALAGFQIIKSEQADEPVTFAGRSFCCVLTSETIRAYNSSLSK